MKKCFNPTCYTLTENPKFCSRSCAAITNNKGRRRHGNNTSVCPKCNGKKDYEAKQCKKCYTTQLFNRYLNKKLANYILKNSASRAKYNNVRVWARKILERSNREKKCMICGFTLVLEVIHRKAVSEFPETALMSEVNSLDNLEYLCPNHHAMYDKGLFNLESSSNG